MGRQVDIKALVSHIVRGDGADKCRICLGDTTEGQVYLGDTVMLDGERPVTLAELLEVITGVEVEEEAGLPRGICRTCSEETIAAVHFKQLCNSSIQHWTQAVTSLSQVHEPTDEDKVYYIFYNGVEETLVRDQVERVSSKAEALERLNEKFHKDDKPEKAVRRQRRTHNRSSMFCKCPDCGKEFSMPYYLNVHLQNTMKRACTQCGLVLGREKLAKHLVKAHNKILFDCNVCHKLFDDEMNLKRHSKESHGSHSHACTVCGNGYSNDRALRAHMYAHTLFHCSSCSLSFENRRCYKYHQNQCKVVERPTESTYICHDCGSTYTKKPSLRIHIIQKHLNVLPYVCDTCGKRTSTLAHLKSHEAIHTSERKIYQCACGAKMRTELGFHLHQRIHTGEKPYECEECGDRFLSASRRLDHIKRRHRSTKDMPHGCDMCSARFVRPFELKKHYVSVHYSIVNVMPVKKRIRRQF